MVIAKFGCTLGFLTRTTIGFDGKPTIESKIELEIELLLSEADR